MLGGTTSLLLLAVFAMVNVAVLVLRRDVQGDGRALQDADRAAGDRFHRVAVPGDAAVRPARKQYLLAGILLVIGIVLFGITLAINKHSGSQTTGITDPTQLARDS